MWKDSLQLVINARRKYDRYVNMGATDDEIKKFSDEVQFKFGYALPKEYLNFLKEVNGIEFNAFIVYGIDQELTKGRELELQHNGFIDNNEIWRETDEPKQYIYFGDADISWFCYDLINKKYVELDKPSGEFIEDYPDFYSMLTRIFEGCLL